jgi:predicted lipoprotein with Yx(FWY)xxD motif
VCSRVKRGVQTDIPLTNTPENSMKLLSTALLTAALLGGCASMTASSPAKVADGVLVGPNGMTLYVFDRDATGSGKSVCNGPCATNWPPLMAADADKAAGDYSVITRDDGKKQWAMKGKPLYYWAKDAKPGDKTGDGFMNVWHVVKP